MVPLAKVNPGLQFSVAGQAFVIGDLVTQGMTMRAV